MTEKLPTLVVASHNTGKITEFERILSAWWRIQPQATLGLPPSQRPVFPLSKTQC